MYIKQQNRPGLVNIVFIATLFLLYIHIGLGIVVVNHNGFSNEKKEE